MKVMKKVVLASALLLAFQQGAMAQENIDTLSMADVSSVRDSTVQQSILPQMSQEDLAAAFGSATPEQKMQIVVLSGHEMKETQGAFWWWAVPLIVRATPAVISFLGGTGGTATIPMWSNRIRRWW